MQLSALHRASQQEEKRRPFYLYIDEMHSFLTNSLADMLAEARKYKLSLFLTHQYLDQIDEQIRSAIFGNVGTIISFRLGAVDADSIEKEFHPPFDRNELVGLPAHYVYLKLLIDGIISAPFSARTLPRQTVDISCKDEIIVVSKRKFTRPAVAGIDNKMAATVERNDYQQSLL
jgi:hypothetical protein